MVLFLVGDDKLKKELDERIIVFLSNLLITPNKSPFLALVSLKFVRQALHLRDLSRPLSGHLRAISCISSRHENSDFDSSHIPHNLLPSDYPQFLKPTISCWLSGNLL